MRKIMNGAPPFRRAVVGKGIVAERNPEMYYYPQSSYEGDYALYDTPMLAMSRIRRIVKEW